MKVSIVEISDTSNTEHAQEILSGIRSMSVAQACLMPDADISGVWAGCIQDSGTKRSHVQMYCNYISAIGQCSDGRVIVTEQDLLLPAEHFEYAFREELPKPIMYNKHSFFLGPNGYWKRGGFPIGSMIGEKSVILEAFKGKLKEAINSRVTWAEPGKDDAFTPQTGFFRTGAPIIDVRLPGSFTGTRKEGALLENVPYWPSATELRKQLGMDQ